MDLILGSGSPEKSPPTDRAQIPDCIPDNFPAEAKDAVERSILTLEARSEVEAFWSGTWPGWVTAPLVAITHPTPSVAQQLPQQLPPRGRTLDEVLAALAAQVSATQEKDIIPEPAQAPTVPQPSPDPATLAHTLSTLLVNSHGYQGRSEQDPNPSSSSA